MLGDFGYQILGTSHLLRHLGSFVVYLFPIFLLGAIILGLWIKFKKNIRMNSRLQTEYPLSRAIWMLSLMSGFLFCLVPALFTEYYPEYTKVYPFFLMAGSLTFCLSFLFHLFRPSTLSEFFVILGKPFTEKNFAGYSRNWIWFRSLAVGVTLLFVFWFSTISHIQGIYESFQVELVSSAIRQDFQEKIEVAYRETGQKNFIVVGCPKGILVEQFWGISGFFYWKGIRHYP